MISYIGRMVLAGIVGYILGIIINHYEHNRSSRAYALICMGAALLVVVALKIYEISPWFGDPARIPAQIISSLGFLGAGLIWVTRDKKVVGLGSASALWLIAILGMLIGIGLHNIWAMGVFFIIMVFWISGFLGIWVVNKSKRMKNNRGEDPPGGADYR